MGMPSSAARKQLPISAISSPKASPPSFGYQFRFRGVAPSRLEDAIRAALIADDAEPPANAQAFRIVMIAGRAIRLWPWPTAWPRNWPPPPLRDALAAALAKAPDETTEVLVRIKTDAAP